MQTVKQHITSKQQQFMAHPFFDALETMESLEDIAHFVPELTFWVMVFQDILRLNEERITDPDLRKIARHHRLEDAGHERWFLHDRNYICGKDSRGENIDWLFGKTVRWARDPAYAILAEIYRSDNEWLNIVLLLSIESTGHVFFEKIVQKTQQIGEDKNLKYFSSSHLDAEMGHSLFEKQLEDNLHATALPGGIRHDALALVDRCYAAFDQLFDGLLMLCRPKS